MSTWQRFPIVPRSSWFGRSRLARTIRVLTFRKPAFSGAVWRRLLSEDSVASRRLNLREIAGRIEYSPTASKLEASLLFYEIARRHFPEEYERMVRLRPPPWVKVLLSNEFPRTTITTRLSASGAFQFGPFRTRAAAERFEQEVLDLFQVRRCQEDLNPTPRTSRLYLRRDDALPASVPAGGQR